MKRTILIADDEHSVRRVVARVLGSEQYEFLAAADGDEALALASERAPDLILLDVAMPKRDGWTVLKALRQGARTRMTPVIFLTGSAEVSDQVSGLDLGADDYVTKPFLNAELKARVGGALRRAEALR